MFRKRQADPDAFTMNVKGVQPLPDARMRACDYALAYAQYSQRFDIEEIMLNAERFLLFLTDDRVKVEE